METTNEVIKFDVKTAIEKICCKLNAVAVECKSAKASNYEWTHRLLIEMGRVAEDFGFSVCPTFEKSRNSGRYRTRDPEWLYDLIWFENNKAGDVCSLKDVKLVLECEWSHYTSDVQYDFEKLLVAKAPLKVLIAEDWQESESVIDMVTREVSGFSNTSKGECYLIALYNGNTFDFHLFSDSQLQKDGIEFHNVDFPKNGGNQFI